jgi:hypothetical protein
MRSALHRVAMFAAVTLVVLGSGVLGSVLAEDGGSDDLGLDEILAGDAMASDDTGDRSVLEDWRGFVELKPRIYYRDRDQGKNDEQLLLESEFEMEFVFTESWAGYFRPRVLVDLLDGDLKRFEPYEAYATYEAPRWDVRFGQFVENWGIVDTYNPIDVINRRDLATGFLDAERLGEIGVRFRVLFNGNERFGEPTLSFYVLPVWQATPFLPDSQRFGFGSDTQPFEPDQGFEPSGSDRGFYAVRFGSTLDSAPFNADIQFLASSGPERFPVVVADPSGARVPVYFAATTLGVGFRAVPNRDVAGAFLSTLTLKAEIVYKDPRTFDDTPIQEPDDYLAYVIGVDREFYNTIRNQDILTVTLEYAGESGANDPTTLFRLFRDDLVARAFWQSNDFARSSLEVRGIYDVDSYETIFELIYERQLRAIHEDVKLSIQWQTFDPPGTGESLFDFFPNNSSVAVGLRWDLS